MLNGRLNFMWLPFLIHRLLVNSCQTCTKILLQTTQVRMKFVNLFMYKGESSTL